MASNDRSAGVKDRPVFYVSDGTGITAETIGHSVLTQFAGLHFDTQRIPFVDSRERAESAVAQIRQAGRVAGVRPIVISTVIHPEIAEVLAISDALVMDVFAPFVTPLEAELGVARQPAVGQAHGLIDFAAYEARIEATNYAMSHDDGVALNFDEAEVVLVGVSRSGKTPTCLYMALHFGVRAGNYPLTDEDLDSSRLPKRLEPYREKLFGLTIDPMRLQQIRQARRPDSPYASKAQCRAEVATAEAMFRRERLPSLSTTHTSIEEIASKVLAQFGIDKHMF